MDAPKEVRISRSFAAPLPFLKALRPHQWSKNLLVFVPAVAGHRLALDILSQAGLAFVCFCAAASSGYLINDILDAAADRAHPEKRRRPVAAGHLNPAQAIGLSAFIGAAGLGGAFALMPAFALVMLAYLAVSFGYSLILKSKIIVDVIVVAGLLTVRVIGGSVVTGIPLSKWLIMFSVFVFLSLSLAKRSSEIATAPNSGTSSIGRRGYRSGDLALLNAMGAAAAYAAALVLAVYIASPEVNLLYEHADRLWFVLPFLVYWLSRVLLLASRGDLNEDPILFAVSDRVTWLVGCLVTAILIAAV